MYLTDDPVNPSAFPFCPGRLEQFAITLEDVSEGLSLLNCSSWAGSDKLHPMLLKSCCSELACPLSVISKKSLLAGSIPLRRITSLVVPLLKSDSRFNPINYRQGCMVVRRIIVYCHLISSVSWWVGLRSISSC